MSDTCVVTLAIGPDCQRIKAVTQVSLRRYAERIGADFYEIPEGPEVKSPHWLKLQIFRLLIKYKRLIYADVDLIIRDDCPNLFNIVPEDKLGAFNEGGFIDRAPAMVQVFRDYGYSLGMLEKWKGFYINTGLMVVSRQQKDLFSKPEKQISNFFEQSFINLRIFKDNVPVFDLDYKFNRMTCLDATGEDRHASYIIHYAGCPGGANMICDTAAKDLEIWAKAAPEYKFKRHIHLDIQGGLGDQIDAEPAVRYLLKHVYNQDDVVVTSHWPRIFQHLTNQCRVAGHGEIRPEPSVMYHRICSLPGPETPMWRVVSNLLCHTVDFCAMALLRRTLPDRDKSIYLDINPEDLAELDEVMAGQSAEDLVIIHPGRHWPSKTFPVEWWQAVIDGFVEKKIPVAIIGKNDETRGTVPVIAREGVLDLRDLLTIGALFALISKARVLVSNDSSPVHIAGAFDNHIVMIPTCKHPDHILPYRKGSKTYKSAAPYQKLTLDAHPCAPTLVYMQTADKVVGDILDYLPEPRWVVGEAVKGYMNAKIAGSAGICGIDDSNLNAPPGPAGVLGITNSPKIAPERVDIFIPKNRIEILDFAGLKNSICVEIGVFKGDYAWEILQRGPSNLFLIDPWVHQSEQEYPNDIANVSQPEFDRIFESVRERFKPYDNVEIVRSKSHEAIEGGSGIRHWDQIEKHGIDFLHIDAVHTFNNCFADLLIWSPLVRDGGYICLHDYTGWYDGVRRAVDAFCEMKKQKILFVTPEANNGSCVIQIRN